MKKLLSIFLLVFCSLAGADDFFDAVTGDNAVVSGGSISHVGIDTYSAKSGGGSTDTVAHTVPSGASALVVVVEAQHYASAGTVTGVTWNGSAMTAVTSTYILFTASSAQAISQAFVINNPASGTHNIVVSYSASPYGQSLAAMSYSGTDTTTATEGGTTASGATFGAHALAPTTTTAAGDMLIGMVGADNFGANKVVCNDTSLYSVDWYVTWGINSSAVYCETVVTGSGETLDFTSIDGSIDDWGGNVFVLRAAR